METCPKKGENMNPNFCKRECVYLHRESENQVQAVLDAAGVAVACLSQGCDTGPLHMARTRIRVKRSGQDFEFRVRG